MTRILERRKTIVLLTFLADFFLPENNAAFVAELKKNNQFTMFDPQFSSSSNGDFYSVTHAFQ